MKSIIQNIVKKINSSKSRFYAEAAVIVFIAVLVFAIAVEIDLFELLHEFSRDHEEWEVDEFFSLFMVSALALSIILYRNINYLKKENLLRLDAEKKIQKMAFYDSLTGLPNRDLFLDRLDHAIKHADRNQLMAAVLFIDLDGFKQVNDSFGHDVGDELLKAMSQRLSRHVRTEDTVARIAGDEFVVIVKTSKGEDWVLSLAERIILSMRAPFRLADREIHVSVSIGISIYPNDSDHGEQLIRNADVAMYCAKKEGKNQFKFFCAEIDELAKHKLAIRNHLHQAMNDDEFSLAYQPIVDIPTGKIVGVEALLRWDSEDLGGVSPDEFIPVAEDMGLIVGVGEWVLKQACTQAKKWHDSGLSDLWVSINISARQLSMVDFVPSVKAVLTDTNVDPSKIELELTETAMMTDVEASIQAMVELKKLGVSLSVDDFGTGYSSISYLQKLQLTRLKIDKSFVENLPAHSGDVAIAEAILSLAQSLDLHVTAEGIETEEQFNFFKGTYCDCCQGFFFGRPMSVNSVEMLIRSNNQNNNHE